MPARFSSSVNYYPSNSIAGANINPDLLLAVFLPALLFESSFSMEIHQIKVVHPVCLSNHFSGSLSVFFLCQHCMILVSLPVIALCPSLGMHDSLIYVVAFLPLVLSNLSHFGLKLRFIVP